MNQFIEFNASYLHPLKEFNTYFTDFDVSVKAGLGMNIFTSKNRIYLLMNTYTPTDTMTM